MPCPRGRRSAGGRPVSAHEMFVPVSRRVRRGLGFEPGGAAVTVNSQQILDTLAARYRDTLARHLGDCDDVVLLDFPNHANVGDSLIWLGEIAALRQLGKTVRHVCSIWDYDPAALAAVLSERTAILLHGGGNLGTIWPQHQALREAVLRDFPQHKVIQLSQSIHFKDEADAAAFGSLAHGHRHFVLFARDHVSQAFACRVFDCAVELVPDSALVLRPRPSRDPQVDVVALLRTDVERKVDGDGPAALKRLSRSARVVDWLEVPGLERGLGRLDAFRARHPRHLDGSRHGTKQWLWEQLAQARARRGIDMLSSGRVVLTDRLHAVILSCLLGRPMVALDNTYGKIGSFVDTWLAQWPTLIRATDAAAAAAGVERLLSAQGAP